MAAVVDRGGLLITEFDNIEPPLNGESNPWISEKTVCNYKQ